VRRSDGFQQERWTWEKHVGRLNGIEKPKWIWVKYHISLIWIKIIKDDCLYQIFATRWRCTHRWNVCCFTKSTLR
jgi:hypothetical protein